MLELYYKIKGDLYYYNSISKIKKKKQIENKI